MRNILNFILKYSRWFVFVIYASISIILLVVNKNYQQSIYLTSANVVTGSVYETWSAVTGYFHLKSINESLQARNAELQNEVLNLSSRLREYQAALSDTIPTPTGERFDYR